MAKTRKLRLVRERKLADLIAPPLAGAVFEASGVVADGRYCFVALDNIRRVLRLGLHLRPGSDEHQWVGNAPPRGRLRGHQPRRRPVPSDDRGNEAP